MLNFCIDCKYCHKLPYVKNAYNCHHPYSFNIVEIDYVTGKVRATFYSCDKTRKGSPRCEYYEPTFWKKLKTKIFGV